MPLKRVNQSYVIATSTKVDVSKVDASKFEDKYFKAAEKKTSSKGESEFFESEPEKKVFCTFFSNFSLRTLVHHDFFHLEHSKGA